MDVPQIIAGRFRIEREIGTGGMGTVYLATHLGLERPVAVKIIKPEFAADRDVAERFLREARTMAKLRHKHAAMIFDAGTLPDGRHFIIMECVQGQTLSDALAREGRFSFERAVKVATEICDVLEEAHQLGIIHRDLKPSNIMLDERGVCVLDFGVAKVLASATETASTHVTTGSGQIVGTPRYMSPEQCLGQRVGARSDLYSLGVLLFEMLAGRPPFTDVLPSAVLVKQATAPPPALPRLRPDVPKSLTLAVHTLLAKRPEDRPRTAAEARAILTRSLMPLQRVIQREIEPLSSTVAALGTSRSLVFRIGTPAALVMAFSAALLAWGYTSESAPRQLVSDARWSGSAEAQLAMTRTPLPTTTFANQPTLALKSNLLSETNNERRVLNDASTKLLTLTESPGSDLEVVRTDSGLAIVAIQPALRRTGATRFFVMEKRRGKFKVSVRSPLDVENFRRAVWTAEPVDADQDGYPEVLFVGSNSSDRRYAGRLVLYIPNERRSYSLLLTGEVTARGAPKIIWSANSATTDAAPFRTLLRQKARSLLLVAKHR